MRTEKLDDEQKQQLLLAAIEKLSQNPISFVRYKKPSRFNRLKAYNEKMSKKLAERRRKDES